MRCWSAIRAKTITECRYFEIEHHKNNPIVQVQKGIAAPTIEGHILQALLKNNWITEKQHATPFDFHFQRAARTDKAVSAVRQVNFGHWNTFIS